MFSDKIRRQSWLEEFLAGFSEGFGNKPRQLVAMVLLAGSLGAVPQFAAWSAPEQQQVDVNHDGKDDLKQMGDGVKAFSRKIDPQAKQVGNLIEQKTDQLGQQIVAGSKQAGEKINQGVERLEQKVNDLNDQESASPGIWTWIIGALVILAVAGLIVGTMRRRTLPYYR